jgi:hypothetical protein
MNKWAILVYNIENWVYLSSGTVLKAIEVGETALWGKDELLYFRELFMWEIEQVELFIGVIREA